ncbi:MAG TPA: hypothetical protein VGL38_05940 [bacterium]|jgi:hypothetical protein
MNYLLKAIRPDTDHVQNDLRTPQGTAYTAMWLDDFALYGDVKDPLGSPMESGA